MTLRLLIFIAMMITSIPLSPRELIAQTELATIAEWTAAEGISGELSGAPIRALGYEAPLLIKQKAFRGGGITHLFYVTNVGEILLGYINQQVTILWRVEGTKGIRATAHGDMAERKMWSAPNSEHAELFAEEVAYWTNRWSEYKHRKEE